MKDTKNRVLEKSLALFNEKGIVNVSLRDISTELNISVGNLQYHFKKREEIVEALYFELVGKIDNEIDELTNDFNINSFFYIPKQLIKIMFLYRFFLIDFVNISKNNNKIKTHYSELSLKRREQFLSFVGVLIEMDILRKPLLENEYCNLYQLIEVISNFWFSNSFIQSEKISDKVLVEYTDLFHKMIFPFLTKKGQHQFSDIYTDLLV